MLCSVRSMAFVLVPFLLVAIYFSFIIYKDVSRGFDGNLLTLKS
jgi:hypothetical protein